MSFGHPFLLLTLLLVPGALLAHRLAERRRMQYAVRFTNVDLLALVATGRPWRRWLAGAAFLLSIATLCVAVSRPHVHTTIANNNATVVLVLDVSGSMQAEDVKPTRLEAAQKALHIFIDKVPAHVKVGLILFAGEPELATPPTTDHALVDQAVDDAGLFQGFGGTAIGDAIAAAVQVGLHSAGVQGQSQASALGTRSLAAFRTAASPHPSSTLVSILFLSDGAQTRGTLSPIQGADRAKAAGIPVYTVALGTTGNTTLRGFGNYTGGGIVGGAGPGFRGLAPDPKTLHAIATITGGRFFRAKTAGAAQAAYSHLGSSIGRSRTNTEVTDWFLAAAAGLLVLGGILSALWAPRLP